MSFEVFSGNNQTINSLISNYDNKKDIISGPSLPHGIFVNNTHS